MVQWTLSRESKIPLWIQLREQLRYVISTGAFEPGQKLPSIRDLAARAHVSINTVVRAFQELEREGLIKSRVGDGSFVSTALYQRPASGTPGQLRSLVTNLVIDASQLGFSIADCVIELDRVFRSGHVQDDPVAWVECNPFELEVFARMIEEQAGVRVRTVLLSELQANPSLLSSGPDRLAGVLTSVFHVTQVKELLRDQSLDVYSVFTNTSPENLKAIQKASHNRKVAFVLRDRGNSEVMINLVEEICPNACQIQHCSFQERKRLQEVLDWAEVVVASGPVFSTVEEMVGRSKPVFHLLDRVDPLSIQMIRELYAGQ